MDLVFGCQNLDSRVEACSDWVINNIHLLCHFQNRVDRGFSLYSKILFGILTELVHWYCYRITALLNAMELTEVFVVLGHANGLLRLMCRDTGSIYADINAHGAAITAMAYSWKAQVIIPLLPKSLLRTQS